MENIVIDTLLYKCKNGTNDRIRKLIEISINKPAKDHENGIAYAEYNHFLQIIKSTKNGTYIENVYTSY